MAEKISPALAYYLKPGEVVLVPKTVADVFRVYDRVIVVYSDGSFGRYGNAEMVNSLVTVD